jgi:hypothetical protein
MYSNDQYKPKVDTCPIVETHNIDKRNGVINYNYYYQPTATQLYIVKEQTILTDKRGISIELADFGSGPVNSTKTFVWTDHEHAILEFYCAPNPSDSTKPNYYYLILVKDRKFVDLDLLDFMFEIIEAVTGKPTGTQTNTVIYLYQGKLCKNQPDNVF